MPTVAEFGRLDIVINNAGIIRWAAFPDADAENLASHLAVHVAGSFNTTRAAWTHMVEQRYGRIVMTTSTGMFGLPDQHLVRHRKGRRHRSHTQPHARGPPLGSRSTSSHRRRRPAWRARSPVLRKCRLALVAPMAAFLAHESCPVSGEIYVAGAGRFARLFLASTRGYVHPGPEPTIEDIAAHWAAINDEAGYFVPADLMAWSETFMAHLREEGTDSDP